MKHQQTQTNPEMPVALLKNLCTLSGCRIAVINYEPGLEIAGLDAHDRRLLRAAVLEHGGLLLRGFGVDHVDAFRDFVRFFLDKQDSYLGGASKRSVIADRIYNTTDAPPDVVIAQHLEATHTPNPPKTIIFNCHAAPTEGGETTLASFAELAQALPTEASDSMCGQRIVYTKTLIDRNRWLHRHLPKHATDSLALSWQEATGTSCIGEAISSLEAEGYEVTRLPNRSIRTRCLQPAVKPHSVLGTLCWQLSDQMTRPLPWFARVIRPLVRDSVGIEFHMESGEPFDPSLGDLVHRTIEEIRFSFRWNVGDVLILDNEQMSHGRNHFAGERLILTAFGT